MKFTDKKATYELQKKLPYCRGYIICNDPDVLY